MRRYSMEKKPHRITKQKWIQIAALALAALMVLGTVATLIYAL